MTFVVTAGQLESVDRVQPSAPYAMTLTGSVTQDYAEMWRTQPALRMVISFLARNVAQLPLQVFERIDDNERQRVTEHPLARIIRRPAPRTTQYRLIDSIMHDRGIFDRAFILKMRTTANRPNALVRLNPRKVRLLGDSPFEAAGYRYIGNRGHRDFTPDEIIHLHGYNPEDNRDGCSSIESLRRVLVEEFYASEYRAQTWRNGARMSGYLKRPANAPDWRKPGPSGMSSRERFRADWRSQYVGSGPQAGGTPILEDGMDFVATSMTSEQAQYLEVRKLSREEVAAAFFVDPTALGMLERATFANVKEKHRQLYQDTLGPHLEEITQELELQLVPEFDGASKMYVEFNLAAKLAGSFEERASVLQTAVGAPYLTRNEARAMDNRPALDGGDELITPLNVLVGGQASPTDSAPPPTPGESSRRRIPGKHLKARPAETAIALGEKVMRSTFERQARVVLSRLGDETKSKAVGDVVELVARVFDRSRWDGELTADLFALNVATASGAAQAALSALGWAADRYDPDRTKEWLAANAERVAGGINGATAEGLVEVLVGVDEGKYVEAARKLFDLYREQRAAAVAKAQTSSMAGFGTTEVARQYVYDATHDPDRDPEADPPEAVKTWHVTSKNPRQSHAALDGTTVPIDEKFANGADWPGDSNLPDGERAGCTCDVTVEVRE